MTLAEVTREDVLQAIEVCKKLGREEFLYRYQARAARYLFLIYESSSYDSTAVLKAAHRIGTGEAYGSLVREAAAAARLESFGFEIVDVRDPAGGAAVQSLLDERLAPGEVKTRVEVAEVFGGGKQSQSGIVPSTFTPTVLIYSNPKAGERLGYIDGWVPDDERGPLFEYTGHGLLDQVFASGNKAIRDHALEGRALRIFKAVGTVPNSNTVRHRYVGRFELDEQHPFRVDWRPNDKQVMRKVIVFRLRPAGPFERLDADYVSPAVETRAILIPADVTTSSLVDPEQNKKKSGSRSAVPQGDFERREAELDDQFRDFMKRHGHEVMRFKLEVEGLASPMFTDLYDKKTHVLYELKGNIKRNAIRMAIGQLMDYRRHIDPPNPRLAVLLPGKPHDDIKALLATLGIALVYRSGTTFIGIPEFDG